MILNQGQQSKLVSIPLGTINTFFQFEEMKWGYVSIPLGTINTWKVQSIFFLF